jgi:hypothetical protein
LCWTMFHLSRFYCKHFGIMPVSIPAVLHAHLSWGPGMIGPFKEGHSTEGHLHYLMTKGKKEFGWRWLWESILRHAPNVQGWRIPWQLWEWPATRNILNTSQECLLLHEIGSVFPACSVTIIHCPYELLT